MRLLRSICILNFLGPTCMGYLFGWLADTDYRFGGPCPSAYRYCIDPFYIEFRLFSDLTYTNSCSIGWNSTILQPCSTRFHLSLSYLNNLSSRMLSDGSVDDNAVSLHAFNDPRNVHSAVQGI